MPRGSNTAMQTNHKPRSRPADLAGLLSGFAALRHNSVAIPELIRAVTQQVRKICHARSTCASPQPHACTGGTAAHMRSPYLYYSIPPARDTQRRSAVASRRRTSSCTPVPCSTPTSPPTRTGARHPLRRCCSHSWIWATRPRRRSWQRWAPRCCPSWKRLGLLRGWRCLTPLRRAATTRGNRCAAPFAFQLLLLYTFKCLHPPRTLSKACCCAVNFLTSP